MASPLHVLIVDGPTETEEVLKAVFEPQGLNVGRLSSRDPDAVPSATPSVVVLHRERAAAEIPLRRWSDVPCVVIGTFLPRTASVPSCRCLQEPFQYGELISAIDELLASHV